MSSLCLCCLIKGEDIVFPVGVSAQARVFTLKKEIQRERDKDTLQHVGSHTLQLWKPRDINSIAAEPRNTLIERIKSMGASLEDFAEELGPTRRLSDIFTTEPSMDHIQIVVTRTEFPDLKRRRLDEPETSTKAQARRWTVNGSIRQIDQARYYYIDPELQPASIKCLDAVANRQYVLLSGARASGKSTRLLWLKKELESIGYFTEYFSFEQIDYRGTEKQFWESINSVIQSGIGSLPAAPPISPIVSQNTFHDAFLAAKWTRNIVLLIDEFSELHAASPEIREGFLRTLRATRNDVDRFAIKSIVSAGTFSILHLNPSPSSTSPFNISDRIDNSYFTLEETRKLFNEFENDSKITIEDNVIEDIWVKSNGHPGIVCLCGRLIYSNLQLLLNHSPRLSYKSWQQFPTKDLYTVISNYPTFRSMRISLMSPSAEAALRLLRTRFAGYLEDVTIPESDEILADFLTAEGILLRPSQRLSYHMASPLLDGYIRTSILPLKFSRTPSIPPEFQKNENNEAVPNVLEILKESLRFFDKNSIQLAFDRAYKRSTVIVGGVSRASVPRESVYDTELMGILSNWLQGNHGWTVTGQWHLRDGDKHKYTDIVLKKDDITIVLELVATGNPAFIRSHIDKSPRYKYLPSADEAWVVHFTCEDNFQPIWQSDTDVDDGLNIVHFSHDSGFTTVRMNARFKDSVGRVTQITDELVTGI